MHGFSYLGGYYPGADILAGNAPPPIEPPERGSGSLSLPLFVIAAKVPAVDWKWYLGRSSNLELIGELDAATQRKLNPALNVPESASFSINGLEDIAFEIEELSTCLLAYRNGKRVWSGPVWTADDDLADSASLTITCVGWFELFNKRLLKCGPNAPEIMPTTTAISQTYANWDQTAIMADLALRTIADSPFLSPMIHVGVVPSTVDNGGARNITYQQFHNIGSAITEMSNIENGFDFRVDPITLALNMFYDLVAPDIPGCTIRGRGKHRPNIVFGYKSGPANLKKLKRLKDGSKVVNDQYALGQYGLANQADGSSIDKYGKFTVETSLSDVPSPTILEAYAAAQVALLSRPQVIYSFDVLPYSEGIAVPQPFEDYDIGDMVGLVGQRGRVKIPESGSGPQPVRMFSFELDIGEEGQEEVKNVQTAFSNA